MHDPQVIEQRLRTAAEQSGLRITPDGRMAESDLAVLLGIAPGTLANRRYEGRAPPPIRLGGAGHRVTYYLCDVAAWLARQ